MPRYAAVEAPKRKVAAKRAPAKRAPVKTAVRRAPVPINRSHTAIAKSAASRAGTSEFGSMLGGLAGMALGGPGGAMIGNALGGIGGSVLSRLFGSGDYQVTNASAIKNNNLVVGNAANIPQFGTGKVASRFKHREFLGDVLSSATANTFKIDSFAINPGLSATFPWLAGVVGAKFQQYRINGMAFEFRSMSSDALNSTNTALGSVIMSTDYDSADSTFTSKQEMENTEYGVSCKPSVNMLHAIECERSQTPVSELYIRAFGVPDNKDIRFYDLARFSIASTGCQGTNVNLGELWVSYDIECFKAIEQVPGYINPVAQYDLTGVDATHSLGTADTGQTLVIDQIGLDFQYTAGTSYIVLPLTIDALATYQLYYSLIGNTTASVAVPGAVFTGGLVSVGSIVLSPYVTGSSAQRGLSQVFRYDGSGTSAVPPTIAITGGVVPTGISLAQVAVSQISGKYPVD